MVQSVYIHIPFCQSICSYCDFCKVFYQEKLVNDYLKSLEKEIQQRYQQEPIQTLYIGGGTPSCLSFFQLQILFNIIEKLNLLPDCEITMEANFESLTEEKILFLKDKINRISLGVETISDRLQKIIERVNSKEEIQYKIDLLKQVGITNINVDLMYALPGETLKELKEDLTFILSLDVPHISTYSLILEKNTKLYLQQPDMISEDLDEQMYQYIENTLESLGYHHYEISNYAKEQFISKHNHVYWENNYYYGFGVGAASYLPGKRMNQTKSLTQYLKENYLFDIEIIDEKENMEYEIILRLRLVEGIDKEVFYRKFGISVKQRYNYQKLVEQQILQETKSAIYVAVNYRYVLNEVIIAFLNTDRLQTNV